MDVWHEVRLFSLSSTSIRTEGFSEQPNIATNKILYSVTLLQFADVKKSAQVIDLALFDMETQNKVRLWATVGPASIIGDYLQRRLNTFNYRQLSQCAR